MIEILTIDSTEVQNALQRRREWMQKRGLSVKDNVEYSGKYKGTMTTRKKEILTKLDELREEINKL